MAAQVQSSTGKKSTGNLLVRIYNFSSNRMMTSFTCLKVSRKRFVEATLVALLNMVFIGIPFTALVARLQVENIANASCC